MRLTPSDPDIQTLVTRIKSGAIDLQPDFQRGFVWSEAKCQRLIDSILRDWHIPPIHLVRDDNEDQVVLDGQQRLTAIRDFMAGAFAVDGNADPRDPEIEHLHDLRYEQLPEKYRRRFDRFTIRVFTITDYSPQEPYELFYRLNESTVLTSSEKRNAFFGPARGQVKDLVDFAIESGLTKQRVGFSNSRMAYDDAISRFCLSLEVGSLRQKITSALVTDRYRSQEPFSETTILRARSSLSSLLSVKALEQPQIRLNKATFHSWLCFTSSLVKQDVRGLFKQKLELFLPLFETARALVRISESESVRLPSVHDVVPSRQMGLLFRLFNDRASARVTDVSSVLLRDLILWISFYSQTSPNSRADSGHPRQFDELHEILPGLRDAVDVERMASSFVEAQSWGDVL